MSTDSTYKRSSRTYYPVGTSRVPKSRGPASITPVSQQILIAVLGVTGAGKSSFINQATETNTLDVGHDIGSCTKQVACVKIEIDGRIVTLIDTPGFDDTNMTDGEVLCLISKWLNDTYQHGMLLTGIILLQPVDGIRAYGSEVRRTRLFREICGQDAFGNVVIGTTMWSKLKDRKDGVKRVEQRKTSGDFWANLVTKGARLEEYHETTESAHRIIRMLMDKTKKPLQLQEELAKAGGRVSGTSAAKQLYDDINMVSSEKQEKLDQIFEEMQSIRKNNEEYQAKISELRNRIANLQYQKELIKTETVRAEGTVPDWIQALASVGTVALGAAAIIVPIAAGGLCAVM